MVTTHLKAKKGFEKMRTEQATQLVDKLTQWNLSATIITGDLNDTPDSSALKVMYDSGIVSCAGAQEPDFTTHKYRDGVGMTTRTIDYMFYQQDKIDSDVARIEQVSGVYELPRREHLPATGYPTENHPSDHLALGYQFTFVKPGGSTAAG